MLFTKRRKGRRSTAHLNVKGNGVTEEATSKSKSLNDTSVTLPPRLGLLFSCTEFILMYLIQLAVLSTTSNQPATKCKPPSLCLWQRRVPAENWIPDWTDDPHSASNPGVGKATSTFTNIHLVYHYSVPSSEIYRIFQAALPEGERLKSLVPVLESTLYLLPVATYSFSWALGTTAGLVT